ncbi:unnamed protein product [Ectocarpus sp. CCAP 1310/34]|nr:unnamed protein product [Ectocarpus sp. CCAP 1310/34]
MHLDPKRALLEEAELEIFKLLSFGATPERWAEWLRAPQEHAAARGNIGLVERLLEAGADGGAGWRGCRSRTMLDAAALGGNADVVTKLLRSECVPDVNVVSVSSKRSALHLAVTWSHEAAARTLMIAGADNHRVDPVNRYTPFHVAAEGGHDDLVDNYLTGGACPNSRSRVGRTPLHLADGLGNNRDVSALLGDANTHMDALDNDGFSPLMLASRNGHRSTVEVLLRAGADTTRRATDSGDFSHMAALDVAAAQGHVRVVKAILGNGGDASAVDDHGCTALHYAALHKHGGEVVDVLLDAGVDVNAKTADGSTPLRYCALMRHDEAMVTLVKRGGNVNENTSNGVSVLHWACAIPRPGVDRAVGLLLRWEAFAAALDSRGETPSNHLELAAALFAGTSAAPRNSVREEIQRALVLLARAPADRTWRRRCWLAMLRARAGREREACSSNSSTGNDRTEAIDRKLVGHDEDDGSKEVGKTDAGGSGSGPMDGKKGGPGRTKRRWLRKGY